MKILLVANYLPDEQQSMLRFARMLADGLQRQGHEVRTIRPEPAWLYRGKMLPRPLHKWLGYLDKFQAFPSSLRQECAWADLVQICDHSNAFYTGVTPGVPCVVTCHDLLAVRGALGEDTDCPASTTGRLLQRWILEGLERATHVACVSEYTYGDLRRLARPSLPARVIRNGLNYDYRVLAASEVEERLATLPALAGRRPYLLHVGSNLRRKNREGILRVFARLKDRWPGFLVFAGAPSSAPLRAEAMALGITDRVIDIARPDEAQLEALYNAAHALLFPSRFEGFGWPPLEAQKCGCPVIVSDRGPLPEIGGEGAFVCSIDDEEAMAAQVLRLGDPDERRRWIERGLKNVARFTAEGMVAEYIALYREVLGR
jgi:glycosyltransferase involved in cell wall biosynthesis